MERALAVHLEVWYSSVPSGRSLPPLGPDDERVGPPDQGICDLVVILDLLSGRVITSVPQVTRTWGEGWPQHAVPWQGTLILGEMLSMTVLALSSDLVGGRAGSQSRAGDGAGWGQLGSQRAPDSEKGVFLKRYPGTQTFLGKIRPYLPAQPGIQNPSSLSEPLSPNQEILSPH